MDDNRGNSNKPVVKICEVVITEEIDSVTPPPLELNSDFKTLQEWLLNICETEKPKTTIDIYDFGLFESPDDYTVFVVGLNTSDKENNHSITTIDFEPNKYYSLRKSEYANLDYEQVLQLIRVQVKEFTNTENFKSSFFAHAKSIKVSSNDAVWLK